MVYKSKITKVSLMVVIMLMVLSFSIVALGAPTYTTTTTYSGDDVMVESTITGVNLTDEITYLVNKTTEGTIQAGDILYIDQANADGKDNVKFSFKVNMDRLGTDLNINADVKFGSMDDYTVDIEPGTDTKDNLLTSRRFNMKVEPGGSVVIGEGDNAKSYAANKTVNNTNVWYTGDSVSFKFYPIKNYTVKSIKAGDTPLEVIGETLYEIPDGANDITVDFKPTATGKEITTSATPVIQVIPEGPSEENFITTFGTVVNIGDVEYGMLLAESESELADISFSNITDLGTKEFHNGVKKFPALGKNELGQFAIKLMNFTGDKTKYYTKTYILDEQEVTFGDLVTISLE